MKMEKKRVGKTVRSVIHLGDALAITLPNAYVRENNIKPGDKVEVLFNHVIVARPLREEKLKEVLEKLSGGLGED
jgi:antitoxin component of MazEF toxin-antitoxin module